MWKDYEISDKSPQERIDDNLRRVKDILKHSVDIAKSNDIEFNPLRALFTKEEVDNAFEDLKE